MKRPWREQAVPIPVGSDGLVLEGVWQAGDFGGAVVAPPHPEYGGSLDNPVVNEIAHALYREGLASLRFNWRGVGGSQGRISGEPGAAEADYSAALEQLAESVGGPLSGAGYSFGAATAVRVALRDPRLRRLILVAPPVQMLEPLPLEALARPVRVIVGDRDPFAPVEPLRRALARVPDVELRLIAGIDHFFATAGLAELARHVRDAVGGD